MTTLSSPSCAPKEVVLTLLRPYHYPVPIKYVDGLRWDFSGLWGVKFSNLCILTRLSLGRFLKNLGLKLRRNVGELFGSGSCRCKVSTALHWMEELS